MKIHSVKFVTSSTSYAISPTTQRNAYAFIGRSNVGKSSLINMLLQRKNLARTSSTPGKTATINYFLVNEAWYLVDLPGYGWARTSQTQRKQWQRMIRDFFLFSPSLAHIFLLVDARHEPQTNDVAFLAWLLGKALPCSLIFTKVDQAKKKLAANLQAFQAVVGTQQPSLSIFTTSAKTKAGRTELLDFLSKKIEENKT